MASGTPGNCHAYWLLQEWLPGEQIEVLNRRLVEVLGGDSKSIEKARLLRVPETLNHKSDPPNEVKVLKFTEARYTIAAFNRELPPPSPTKEPATKQKPKPRSDLKDASPIVQTVLDRLNGVKGDSPQWTALCPAHDDQNPSLSVAEGEDGRCLLKCHAGCDVTDVASALGLTLSDLMSGDGGAHPRKRIAAKLVEMAFSNGAELFHSADGDAWISITNDGSRNTWPVESRMSEMWLRRSFFEESGEAVAREALAEATAQLGAHALFEGNTHEVEVRVAGSESESIFLDLGDEARTIIKIDGSGFEIAIGEVPYFRRASSATGLPLPVGGGSIEQLRDFVNIADEGSWMRLVGFLLMCFHPTGPYPVLSINGEQGSAKTTTSRLILSLIDPHKAGLMSGNPPIKGLAITASANWLVVLDNVSSIKVALSDALCRVSTGGGLRTRRLYTDSEEIALEYRRPVVVNGIGSVITRPDLLDRTAPIELLAIQSDKRRTETSLMKKWEVARPSILGALLTAVAAAIANRDQVKLDGTPRLADWAQWVEAASDTLGWPLGAFTAAVEAGQDEQVELSIDDHVEVRGLIEYMDVVPELKLTATELLEQIHAFLDLDPKKSPELISQGSELSRLLSTYGPALRKHGIHFETGRTGGGVRQRFVHVWKA